MPSTPALPLLLFTRCRARFRFSRSHTSSISAADAGRSVARVVVGASIPPMVPGRTSSPSGPSKARHNWIFGCSALMRPRSYWPRFPFGPSVPGPTMPAADFCAAVTRLTTGSVPDRDTTQTSRDKFDHCPHATAGFTLRALDGYGLCDVSPARPALTPPIRFLSIGPCGCSALPPDPASRRRPCASLAFTSIRLAEDFHLQVVEHARRTTERATARVALSPVVRKNLLLDLDAFRRKGDG